MADEDQRLVEDARRSREQTQQLREESGLERDAEPGPPAGPDPTLENADGEPWAKTSSGDADNVTTDDD